MGRRGGPNYWTLGRFSGSNSHNLVQVALNEWFGLLSSTQDHAESDGRTLADFRTLLSKLSDKAVETGCFMGRDESGLF